jgi:uncharacterized protein (TIRG00374 family)
MPRLLKFGQYALVCFCLITFFYMVRDFRAENLKKLFSEINYSYIIFAMFFAGIVLMIKAIRLQILSEQFNLFIKFPLAYKTQVISIIYAILTPGRVGEVSKIFLLSENQSEKFSLVTSITLFEMFLDFLCILFISLIFSVFALKNILISLIISFIILIVFIIAFSIKKISSYKEKFPSPIKSFFINLELNEIKITHKLYLTIPFTISAWCLDGVFQYFILKAVKINSEVIMLVALSAISSIISIVSVLPLGFGVTDLSSLFLYKSFVGLEKEQIIYLINSTRFFLVITLLLMAIPYLKVMLKVINRKQ